MARKLSPEEIAKQREAAKQGLIALMKYLKSEEALSVPDFDKFVKDNFGKIKPIPIKTKGKPYALSEMIAQQDSFLYTPFLIPQKTEKGTGIGQGWLPPVEYLAFMKELGEYDNVVSILKKYKSWGLIIEKLSEGVKKYQSYMQRAAYA